MLSSSAIIGDKHQFSDNKSMDEHIRKILKFLSPAFNDYFIITVHLPCSCLQCDVVFEPCQRRDYWYASMRTAYSFPGPSFTSLISLLFFCPFLFSFSPAFHFRLACPFCPLLLAYLPTRNASRVAASSRVMEAQTTRAK